MTMSETPQATPADLLAETESQLRQVIETLIEAGVMVHDFQGTVEAKEGLTERVNLLTSQLNDLNAHAFKLDQKFPVDVVDYIENGRNPDVYTREFVELLAKKNQYLNGKMKAMKVSASSASVLATTALTPL